MTWYVLSTKPRAENKAEEALSEIGYDVYSPLIRIFRAPKKRRGSFGKIIAVEPLKEEVEEKLVPLYRGYMFVRKEEDKSVGRMLEDEHGVKVRGVNGVVKSGPGLATVTDDQIDDIKYLVEVGMLDDEYGGSSIRYVFKVGQMVQFATGPLEGRKGYVTSVDKSNRVSVLTDLLGGRPVVVTRLDELEALS